MKAITPFVFLEFRSQNNLVAKKGAATIKNSARKNWFLLNIMLRKFSAFYNSLD